MAFLKYFGVVLMTLAVFLGVQYFWTGSPPEREGNKDLKILAHRGVHLNYRKGVYDPISGCEAKHIFEPTHGYIENTIESIGAAFDYGATIVEIDLRKTSDSNLVVFHDWMLDCRTDGEGEVKDHPVSYLKTLDIGYGYTSDDGDTYPMRGKGIGKMPTLAEVLQVFPTQRFLLDHKDGDTESIRYLVNILKRFPEPQASRLTYWGPEPTLDLLQETYPQIRRFFVTRRQAKTAFAKFIFSFGLTGLPDELRGLTMAMPVQYTKYLWGWPNRFISRVHSAGLDFYLMVDSVENAEHFKDFPIDGIVTDYVERIGPYLQRSEKNKSDTEGRYVETLSSHESKMRHSN